MPGWMPYRGQGSYPKTRKRRYVPATSDKEQGYGCGCSAFVGGIGLASLTVMDKTTWMVYFLLIYLLFLAIAFFAILDLKKIKLMTPDEDARNHAHEPDDKDRSSNQSERPYQFIGAQKLKDERGLVARKHRMNEHGHKMSKHSKK